MSRRSLLLTVALVLAALTWAVASGARQGPVTVASVTDGDTLRLRSGDRVRLLQIDAPEAGEECYAGRATAELARLVPRGARVGLEVDTELEERDRYGRLLRYVHVGRTNVNVELVRRGAATPYFYDGERGAYARSLLAALAEARRARRGMWSACRVLWNPDSPVTTLSR